MKYRIVTTNNDLLPYVIERKDEKSFFPRWKRITKLKSFHESQRFVKDSTERHSKHPAGTVVLEYDEADLVVERLKNEQNKDRAVEGAQMNVTSAMAMSPMVSKEHIAKLAGLR